MVPRPGGRTQPFCGRCRCGQGCRPGLSLNVVQDDPQLVEVVLDAFISTRPGLMSNGIVNKLDLLVHSSVRCLMSPASLLELAMVMCLVGGGDRDGLCNICFMAQNCLFFNLNRVVLDSEATKLIV